VHDEPTNESIRAARVVLPCTELQATMDFFVDCLGFRPLRISPADDPRTALLSGYGIELCLVRGSNEPPPTLQLICDDPALDNAARELVAPNGTRIELCQAEGTAPLVPAGEQELIVTRADGEPGWVTGRAGMLYRDLLPGRMGGRFIASRIRIPDGGPVPDRVHYHAIRFQMIYCAAGWVRVVYEDQGPPFVLAAGDCVLQPPGIRHRVLESSAGLEVIEVGCPAEHDTFFDHELELPTADVAPKRAFGGQRFVHHVASTATWRPWTALGFECRDLGFTGATDGLATAQVVRGSGHHSPAPIWRHAGELLFVVVLKGSLTLAGTTSDALTLEAGDSIALPPKLEYTMTSSARGMELLELRLTS
jgi:quercetin dioxygenase-like cupin family protein